MIEVKKLVKRYGDVVAVNEISFEVKKGEILGFLGPNAAGKTTTMRILTGFMLPNAGTASVAGYDIFTSAQEIQRRIGYLPENNPLYHDIPVEDYLRFVAAIREIPRGEINEKIRKVTKACGLKSVLKNDIGELSRGFRQRVGLAQAMLHDPPILILDEPTSGLDPKQIVEIRELIKELGREKTVVLSTHILSEVSATCNRVIIINKGKVVISGKPSELQDLARGETKVKVKIRGAPGEVREKLEQMEAVKRITLQERVGENITRFELGVEKGKDICEDIFFLARDNNWSLMELSPQVASLEDIFLQLTAEE